MAQSDGSPVGWWCRLIAPLALAGLPTFSALLGGCGAARMPDVGAEAGRLTGMDGAIVYREHPLAIDGPPPADRTLTPDRAVRLVLARDPRVQAALAKVRVAAAEAHQARLLPNPVLTIDIRYAIEPSNTAFEPSLTADLLSLLQKPSQIAAADDRLRAAAAGALTTVLDVIAEVEEACASARSLDIEIENARRREDRVRRLRDIAQKRLRAGDATRLDVLTADAQLMQAELDVADFALQREDQRLTLNRLLGYPRTDVEWDLSSWQPAGGHALAPEAQWVDAALASRPEVQGKVWELRALGEELAGASLPPLQGGEIGAHAEHDPEWRLGPTTAIPLPLFDFGQAAREKVRAERVAARFELEQARLEVIQNVRSAYATLLHAQRALAGARDKLLPLQARQLEGAQLAYQAGDADFSTLLLAQNEYELTLTKAVELEEKVTVARAKLARAAGGAAVAARLVLPATAPTAVPATAPASEGAATRPATRPSAVPATGPVP